MGIIIGPPQMGPAAVPHVLGVPQHMPVRDAVDSIGEGFLCGLLQPSPDEMLDIIVQGIYLGLDGSNRLDG